MCHKKMIMFFHSKRGILAMVMRQPTNHVISSIKNELKINVQIKYHYEQIEF